MANSAVVGILRALLTADTAQFESGMRKASGSAKLFARETKTLGLQASQLGSALSTTLTLPILAAGASMAKVAMDFESSFTGVRKTVKASGPELAAMAQQFRNLSKTIPINVNDLNRLGEAAGALGIPKKEIVDFSRVMALLGVTTNVSADQAATSIAKIQNVFGAAGKETENFASALVALGNDGASTEAEILALAQRIASAGSSIGMSQSQVLGFASAIANVGMEAEAGGSALSQIFAKIALNASKGAGAVEGFARVAGMSGESFRNLFRQDSAEAMTRFVEGLGRVKDEGGDLIRTLTELDITEIRQSDLMKRLAGNADDLRKSLDTSGEAWRKNTALSDEARERFKDTEQQMKLLWNQIRDLGITLGNALLPMIKSTIAAFQKFMPVLEAAANFFAGLPMPVQAAVVGFLGLVAAAGPVIYVFGQIALSASAIVAAFGAKGIATKAITLLLGGYSSALTWATTQMAAFRTALFSSVGAAGALTTALGVLGAAFIGWQIGKGIADLKMFGDAQMSVGESFEYGATKIANWVRGVKASDRDIETAILSRRKLKESTDDTTAAVVKNAEAEVKAAIKKAEAAAASATLRAELEAHRRTLSSLTADQRANIAAGIEMGQSTKEIAEAVGVAEQVIELYKKAMDRTATATKEAARETKQLEKDVAAALVTMHKLALTNHAEQLKEQAKIAEKTADTILGSFNRRAKAEEDAAEQTRQTEYKRAEYAIEQAKRRGASERQLFEMEHALNRRRMEDAVRTADAEFAAKVAGLDRTTAYGEAEYQALERAHRASVQRISEDFEQSETLRRESIFHTTTLWAQSWETAREGLLRIGQDITASMGRVLFNFGHDMDGTLRETAESARANYERIRDSGTASAEEIQEAFEAMRAAEDEANYTFGERFIDLWKSIKASLFSLFNDILGQFINGLIKGMIGAMLGQQGSFSQAFAGLFGGGGGGGGGLLGGLLGGGGGGSQGGGGLLGGILGGGQGGGGILGGLVGGPNASVQAVQAGNAQIAGIGGGAGLGAGLMGNLARFGGGGLMAAGGAIQMIQAGDSWMGNILGGAQTGAGIGTMVLPGVGTLIGAGIGAAGGALKAGLQKLFGGPDQQERDGRSVSSEFKAEIARLLNSQQQLEAGGVEWKKVVIGVRDAYLATGKTEQEAFAAVNAMYAAEKDGAAAVQQALIPINLALHEQRQNAERVGLEMVEAFNAGTASAEEVMDALARIKAPDDIVVRIRTQIEGGDPGGVGGTVAADIADRLARQAGARAAVEAFRSANPHRAPEIDDFLQRNPEDWDRLAHQLGLPGYHTGGMVERGPSTASKKHPGEIIAKLLVGEAVLTAPAVGRLGGPLMVDALNAGSLSLSDPFASMGFGLAQAQAIGSSGRGATLPATASSSSASSSSGEAGGGGITVKIDQVVFECIDGPSVTRVVESGEFTKALIGQVRKDAHQIRSALSTLTKR